MNTTQTRKPFLTPAARSRPQLFCRDAATGKLLWSRDDGLPIHTNRDLKISFPESCGLLKQDDGLISVGVIPSTVFVHEYQGMILMMTHAGDLLTCDADGNSLAVRRGVLANVFSGAVGASGRTVWAKITQDDTDQLLAIDIINGIQSVTSGVDVYAGPRADGSIIVSVGSSFPDIRLASLNPDGSYNWGPTIYNANVPTEYPGYETNGYWGSFANGDLVTSKGVISANSGEVIATWPEGDDWIRQQYTQNVVQSLPMMVFSVNDRVLAFTWEKLPFGGFGIDDGFLVGKIYRTIYDRDLNIIKSETFNDFIEQYIEEHREELLGGNVFLEDIFGSGAEFYFDQIYYDGKLHAILLEGTTYQFRVDLPFWFVSDLNYAIDDEGRELLYYPNTAHLMGIWEDEIDLPDPVVITPAPAIHPHANKKRFAHSPIDHEFILRYSSGFLCHLAGSELASFDSAGQLRWRVPVPDGPQQGTTNYVLSDDGTKIYYVN